MRQTEQNKGFSLIEVIVGMLMLTIVIVSVLTAFTASAKNNVRTKKEQSAENLAVNLMEYAKAGGEEFSTVFGGTEEVPGATGIVVLSDVPEGFFSYDVVVEKKYDAVEYDKDLLNAYETVRLGATDDRSVYIELGRHGAGYDSSVVRMFQRMHEEHIDELNEEAEVEAEEEGDPAPEPEVALTESEIRQHLTRELVLTAQSVSSQKMQLVAELVYELDPEVELPEDIERTVSREVCTSVEFDRGDLILTNGKKLEQIYILYAPYEGKNSGTDIRILDGAKVLNSKVFLVWQETTGEVLNAELFEKDLATRTGGAQVSLSYTSRAGLPADPYHLELYSAMDVNGEYSPNVVSHPYALVSTGSGTRIASISVQIKDPDSGAVLVELSGAYTE